MKALVFKGPNHQELIDKPKPTVLHSGDAIVKITKTTICGTDLHIMGGDVPEVVPGLTLGHEGVGIIDSVGDGVTNFKVGDKVLISCITACGKCKECKRELYSHCEDGGWILGHLIDGTQAQYVRIPHADYSLYHIPPNVSEEAMVMLSDIFPTGFEIGVLAGKIKPGDTVAIIGAGPIGLAALLTAQFYSPSEIIMIDIDDNRLEVAKRLGSTRSINSSTENVEQKILEFTNKEGVDVAIEAVGIPDTFIICQQIISAGGYIANIGVHGKKADLHLEKLWIKNITITMGLVNTNTTPMLLKTVQSGKLQPQQLITHHFTLDQILTAYDTFKHAAVNKTLKVIIAVE